VKVWILILFIQTGQGRGLDTIEFRTRELCEKASKKFSEVLPHGLFHIQNFQCIEIEK